MKSMIKAKGPREQDVPIEVEVKNGLITVTLQDGREISTPLDWYPML
jgi:hypothetical protein